MSECKKPEPTYDPERNLFICKDCGGRAESVRIREQWDADEMVAPRPRTRAARWRRVGVGQMSDPEVREILTEHLLAVEDRNDQRTEGEPWADLSDIYLETERKLRAAIIAPVREDLAHHVAEEKRLRDVIWEWGLYCDAGSPQRTAASKALYGSPLGSDPVLERDIENLRAALRASELEVARLRYALVHPPDWMIPK